MRERSLGSEWEIWKKMHETTKQDELAAMCCSSSVPDCGLSHAACIIYVRDDESNRAQLECPRHLSTNGFLALAIYSG